MSEYNDVPPQNPAKSLFPRGFKPWQERLMQAFLKQYKIVENISFQKISADIEISTGVSIDEDTISRFIRRNNEPTAKNDQKDTKIENKHAIASFLITRKIVDLEKLSEKSFPFSGRAAFIESLKHKPSTEIPDIPEYLVGNHFGSLGFDDNKLPFRLIISKAPFGKIFDFKFEIIEPDENLLGQFFALSFSVSGWGVVSPEKMIFLQGKDSNGRNTIMISRNISNPLTLFPFGSLSEFLGAMEQSVLIEGLVFDNTQNELLKIFGKYEKINLNYDNITPVLSKKLRKSPKGSIHQKTFMENATKKLHQAVRQLNSGKADEALDEGANVNAIDPETGLPHLHVAVMAGDLALVLTLTAREEINLLATNREGLTAGVIAHTMGYTQLGDHIFETLERRIGGSESLDFN